jgi:hypothetical protein
MHVAGVSNFDVFCHEGPLFTYFSPSSPAPSPQQNLHLTIHLRLKQEEWIFAFIIRILPVILVISLSLPFVCTLNVPTRLHTHSRNIIHQVLTISIEEIINSSKNQPQPPKMNMLHENPAALETSTEVPHESRKQPNSISLLHQSTTADGYPVQAAEPGSYAAGSHSGDGGLNLPAGTSDLVTAIRTILVL